MNRNRRNPTYIVQRLDTQLAMTAALVALLTQRIIDHWAAGLASTVLLTWLTVSLLRDAFRTDDITGLFTARLSADVQRGTQPPTPEDQ